MDDTQIIDLYWDRDQGAITATAGKYGSFLHALSWNILRSHHDAEECVNDTYFRAWNAIPPERPSALRAWLGRITRNLSLDRWKGGRTQSRGAGMETLLGELDECIPDHRGPEQAAEELRALVPPEGPVLVLGVVGGTVGARLSQQHKSAAAVEKYGSNVLKLYLPGEYLGENVISDFEKQYGVRVIVENFDSNEMMYTKLMAGDRYDVIIPSDYMIERLMNEDFLQPLDKSMIPNMENMSDAVLGMSYDPDNTYSIPYFWGSVGLVYNHENVDPAVIESEGWEVLRNTDYAGHIYIYDSERDSFMMAFKALGYSMNTEDPNEINDAYEWLLQMNNTMSPVYVTDEVIDGMMNGYKDIAVVYSGDAAVVLDENEDMSFYMPSQGTNIWCDAMVIPQNAENPKLAHEFINYMLTYEAAFDNTETVGYTSPNAEVFEEMTSSEDLYADNAAYLPRSGYDKDEMFHDNQTLMRELSKLWIKVKAAK